MLHLYSILIGLFSIYIISYLHKIYNLFMCVHVYRGIILHLPSSHCFDGQ